MPQPKTPARPAKSNPTGVAPAATRRTRIKHERWRKAFDLLDFLDDLKGLAWSHIWRTPKYAVRFWANRADWFAIPTLAAALWLAGATPVGCALLAAAAIAWRHAMTGRHLPPPIAGRVELRERNAYQRKFRKLTPWRPHVVKITHHPHKTVVECTYPLDAHTPDVLNAVGFMQRTFGPGTVVEFPPNVLDRFRMVIPHDDILSRDPIRPTFDVVFPHLSRYEVPVGVDKDGQIIWYEAVSQHFMAAGMTRKGKTTSLDSMKDYARHFPYVEFREYAPKPKESEWFAPHCAARALTIPDAAELLEQAVDDANARYNELPPGKYWPSQRWPLVILALDEYVSLFSGEAPPAIEKRCKAALAFLLRKGAGAGFVVWAATQDLHKAGIDSNLVGQFAHKLGFYVADTGQSTPITGSQRPENDLSKLPPDQPGRAIWIGGIPTFQHCRTFRRLSSDLQPPDVFPPPPSDLLPSPVPFPSPSIPQPVPDAFSSIQALGVPERPQNASDSEQGPSEAKSEPSSEDIRRWAAEQVQASNGLGVRTVDLAAMFGVSVPRVKRQLTNMRREGIVRTDGTRWFWGAGS